MARRRNAGNPIPAYFRLQQELQGQIESGRLAPGERIPPERALAQIQKVSVGTVTKAILNLVHEGYLYRVQGSGTFVAGTTLRRESLRYYRSLREFGDKEADLTVKLLDLIPIDGLESVNRYLGIRRAHGLFRLRRLMISEERRVVYSVSFLPQKLFKGLEEFPPNRFEKVPLYTAIEESYGLPTIFNRELLSAEPAEAEVAEHLEVRAGTPVLVIEMLAFTYKERPYEYRRSHCLTESRRIFREF